ncbi:DUF433 domain-containing protein [Tepidiforma sp.]|uniref:DUF433 domain-containing protein n=1 Tax=Tepidiforma sp. TaxID=2682230 RepID=UPI002ADDD355|nr:DUF433 domain-containing protein [Tepidiforma sp.]
MENRIERSLPGVPGKPPPQHGDPGLQEFDLLDRLRREPRYTIAEAARLAGTSAPFASRWLSAILDAAPADTARRRSPRAPVASFLDLIELVVADRLRLGAEGAPRIPFARLRTAYQFARKQLAIDRPFASQRLYRNSPHIFRDLDVSEGGPGHLAVDLGGQFGLPGPVHELAAALDFDSLRGLALRWFPAGRDARIVIDPTIASGRPSIAGRNLQVDLIVARFRRAGESIDSLAKDLELDRKAVEAAVRFAA